jgi:hypothetical protein
MTSRNLMLLGLALPALVSLTGCLGLPGTFNPFAMGPFTPIPVQPWMGDRIEEKYDLRRDFRTPVMPPIPEGGPLPLCEDPPTEREILRALARVTRGVPYFYEEFKDDIEFVTERLVDRIDPPRFDPLIGPVQLHHCHWKCTVYWTETIQSDQPFPVKLQKRRVEVVYIDKDHLHLCVSNPKAAKEITRELTAY